MESQPPASGRPLFIPVVLGTTRQGRSSEHVARFVLSVVEKRVGVETQLVDLRAFPFPASDAGEAIKDPVFSELCMKELVWMAKVLRQGRESVSLE